MMVILTNIFQSLSNNIYIGLLITAYIYAFCKPQFEYLFKISNELEKKNDILHQSIIKLKNIIDIDNELANEQSEQLKQIKKEIMSIKRIMNIECDENDNELSENNSSNNENENEDYEEQNSSDSNSSPKNKPALPLQNHITFPHFFIINEKNFKQNKLHDNTYQVSFIGDNLRLISNQLAKFIKVKCGTCMEFDEAYELVFHYIQDNDITNISEDTKLRRLFGINENEDYEFTDSIMIKALKKMLEPHFKKITYECNMKN